MNTQHVKEQDKCPPNQTKEEEKEMATHSSTLAWKIPWTEEPGGLQSLGLQRVGHDWATSLSVTMIILNSFSGRLPIFSSFVRFGGQLSCPFTCWIFLCLLILFGLLCLGRPFCKLEVCDSSYCGGSSLWVELEEWLVNVSRLGKLVSVFWWMELDLFSLECHKVSSI